MKIGTSFFKVLLGLTLLVTFNISCSSKKSESAKISFQFQEKVSGQSVDDIETIIVNVSGPGLPLQVRQVECEFNDCSQIEVEVLTGSNRLIQLLVLRSDDDDTTFVDYGDRTIDITSGDNPVEIQLEEKGSFLAEGRVQGRYIPSSGHALANKYLTGVIKLKVFVGAGRPDMQLMTREIFGGFFNIFALDNIPFKYIFTGYDKNGNFYKDVPIFDDLHDSEGMDLDSLGLRPDERRVVHFSSDITVFDERGSGNFVQRPFSKRIVGLFGENLGDRKLCADVLSAGTTFDGTGGVSHICTAVSANTCSTFATWGDILVTDSALNGTANSCSGNDIEVDIEDIGEGGNSDFIGVVGPFVEDASAGITDVVTVDQASGEVRWKLSGGTYLPGGVELFVRANDNGFDEDDVRKDGENGLRCDKLASYDFESKGVVNGSTGVINIGSSFIASNPNLIVALCPRKPAGGSSYYDTGLLEWNDSSAVAAVDLVEFGVYDDAGTALPNWGLGGSNWIGYQEVPISPSESGGAARDTFVAIRNLSSTDSVDLSNIHLIHQYATYLQLDDSPSANPVGTGCGMLPTAFQLPPSGNCVVKITTSGAIAYPGVSLHSVFDLSVEKTGDPSSEVAQSFKVVGGSFFPINYSDSALALNFHAPTAENDYKYIRLYNNNGSDWDLSALAPMTWGNVDVYPDCPASLGVSNDCFVLLKFHNPSGSPVTDGASNDGGGSLALPGGSTASLTSALYTSVPTMSPSAPSNLFDFGSISGDVNQTFTISFPSAYGPVDFGTTAGLGGNFSYDNLAGPDCSGNSTNSCDIKIDVTYSPGLGFDSEWAEIPYQVDTTGRAFSFYLDVIHN